MISRYFVISLTDAEYRSKMRSGRCRGHLIQVGTPVDKPQLLKKKATMKRSKPDILVMLVLILGLGLTLSGMSKGDDRERVVDVNAKASGILLGTEPSRQ